MNNVETLLATTVDKDSGNASEDIFGKFIKPRTSRMFVHPAYSMDGTGPFISVSVPHKEFSSGALGVCLGGKQFSDGFRISLRINEAWSFLVTEES